jgi:hypothetical protein
MCKFAVAPSCTVVPLNIRFKTCRSARRRAEANMLKTGKLEGSHYAARAKACPQCHAGAGQLIWFYFDGPAKTWEQMCGLAG